MHATLVVYLAIVAKWVNIMRAVLYVSKAIRMSVYRKEAISQISIGKEKGHGDMKIRAGDWQFMTKMSS